MVINGRVDAAPVVLGCGAQDLVTGIATRFGRRVRGGLDVGASARLPPSLGTRPRYLSLHERTSLLPLVSGSLGF